MMSKGVHLAKQSKRFRDEEQSLDLYLREIGETPLISADEEVELAKRIRRGDHLALEKLTKANLRFVVSVAKQYQNQGLSLADLINEGNIGLIKAAKRFDETRGFKFISYAVWWIRQAILQALAEQSRIVRLPLNRVGTLHKIGKISSNLEQEFGREPSADEIAHELELFLSWVEEVAVMERGKVIFWGLPDELCQSTDPKVRQTASLPVTAELSFFLKQSGLSSGPVTTNLGIVCRQLQEALTNRKTSPLTPRKSPPFTS